MATGMLTDSDVRTRLTADVAIGAVREALARAHAEPSPQLPRTRSEVGDGHLVLSGAAADGWLGLRLRPGGVVDDDVSLGWDPQGRLAAMVVGRELGLRRSGAVGAVAVDVLSRRDASSVALIGSGRQARGQLWGIAAVREVAQVRAWSPTAEHVARFVDRAEAELGLRAIAAPDARRAVEGADVVVLATDSPRPVIDPAWVTPGAHVSSIGPKGRSRHEAPAELADSAVVLVVDHVAQIAALGEPFLTDREPVELGAVVLGAVPGRQASDDITMFCSAGSPAADLAVLRALSSGGAG